MQLFTFNDAKYQRKITQMLTLTVNRPIDSMENTMLVP